MFREGKHIETGSKLAAARGCGCNRGASVSGNEVPWEEREML